MNLIFPLKTSNNGAKSPKTWQRGKKSKNVANATFSWQCNTPMYLQINLPVTIAIAKPQNRIGKIKDKHQNLPCS